MKTEPKEVHPVIAGLIARDALVPERVFYGVYGCRDTFSRWRRKGLTVHRINGKPMIRPSELFEFIERLEMEGEQ